jgi:alpha-D-ribose 1-methylphosphonate 5-triphosphate diphosphatase
MWLSNLKLVLPDRVLEPAGLRIEGDVITDIIEGQAPRVHLDGRGLTALPGFVDVHGDMLEREIEPRPTSRFPVDMALHELDKCHAASGITTAYVALSFADFTEREDDLRITSRMKEVVETIVRQKTFLACDTRVHARFEITNAEAVPLLQDMIEKEQVDMISLMDHTPGQGQFRDLEGYVTYMMK